MFCWSLQYLSFVKLSTLARSIEHLALSDSSTVTFFTVLFSLSCWAPLPIQPLIVFKDRMSTF